MLANRILSACGGTTEEKLYVDDVFSSYLRTGAGADVTVNTGIDMTKGYMLWSKSRSAATDHAVYDSARGVTYDLVTNSTAAQTTQSTGLKAVSSTGHTIGSLAKMNTSGATYVDFVFRKAPKFFDVAIGVAGSSPLNHSLGVIPGMVIMKSLESGDWWVAHRGTNGLTKLNGTGSALYTGTPGISESGAFLNCSDTQFGLYSSFGNYPFYGSSIVAYLFAHDTSTDGLVQCGSFTTDASGNATVSSIGWEPQFGMFKASSTTGDWIMLDTMRGWNMTANDATLLANTSGVETTTTERGNPTATGFEFKGGAANATYIYTVIRRPNKPPTSGTVVYSTDTQGGTKPGFVSGFTVDLAFRKYTNASDGWGAVSRLHSGAALEPNSTAAEVTGVSSFTFDSQNGWMSSASANPSVRSWMFKRAPGFMDVVCYTGTGAARTVSHNLGVTPELMVVKSRGGGANNGVLDWPVYSSALGPTKFLYLNATSSVQTRSGDWNDTSPTSTVFTVGTQSRTNESGANFIAYLFASLPGISKIGTYTGNGGTQTINCGFTTGARFVLVKRTDSTGNWIVADSVRGITAAGDPALYLNSTAAEVTGVDWCDPDSSGFIINQESTMNANVNGATYIFLAIS